MAFRLLLSKQKRKQLKEQTRYLSVDPDSSNQTEQSESEKLGEIEF